MIVLDANSWHGAWRMIDLMCLIVVTYVLPTIQYIVYYYLILILLVTTLTD